MKGLERAISVEVTKDKITSLSPTKRKGKKKKPKDGSHTLLVASSLKTNKTSCKTKQTNKQTPQNKTK